MMDYLEANKLSRFKWSDILEKQQILNIDDLEHVLLTQEEDLGNHMATAERRKFKILKERGTKNMLVQTVVKKVVGI